MMICTILLKYYFINFQVIQLLLQVVKNLKESTLRSNEDHQEKCCFLKQLKAIVFGL